MERDGGGGSGGRKNLFWPALPSRMCSPPSLPPSIPDYAEWTSKSKSISQSLPECGGGPHCPDEGGTHFHSGGGRFCVMKRKRKGPSPFLRTRSPSDTVRDNRRKSRHGRLRIGPSRGERAGETRGGGMRGRGGDREGERKRRHRPIEGEEGRKEGGRDCLPRALRLRCTLRTQPRPSLMPTFTSNE